MDNNYFSAIKDSVLKQLDDFNNGNSWVTDKLGKNVFSNSPSVAFKRVDNYSHSVAEQLAHIIAWRNFAVQKLKGDDDFDIEDNSLADWPKPSEWNALSRQYESCHQELIAAIKNFPAEQLDSKVPGRRYSYLYLINGIVEHDYYHFGQINSLLAAIKKMPH